MARLVHGLVSCLHASSSLKYVSYCKPSMSFGLFARAAKQIKGRIVLVYNLGKLVHLGAKNTVQIVKRSGLLFPLHNHYYCLYDCRATGRIPDVSVANDRVGRYNIKAPKGTSKIS